MPKALDADVRRLIDAPNFAAFTTLMPDGAPKVEPVWVAREGDYVLVATDSRGVKGKNVENDKRVALSVSDFANPYEQALIRGRVIEIVAIGMSLLFEQGIVIAITHDELAGGNLALLDSIAQRIDDVIDLVHRADGWR